MPAVSTFIGIAVSIAISVAVSIARMLLTPKPTPPPRPAVPKNADGKFNLRQNVPSLTRVYGRVKKAGDYVFLGEKNGSAYHCIVWAGHRIEGFVQHWLHDEAVTLGGGGGAGVTDPAHFEHAGTSFVQILERNGAAASTAYSPLVTNFPANWTDDHRGDGLASVLMIARAVSQETFSDIFTNGSPQHSAVGDGALLYDPRDESTAFSTNIALMRFDHLTSTFGGKWSRDDMYLPDWIAAADVCDETVTNRDGDPESRYHGGLWFYESNDPVDVGRKLDEAADLVVYERADGTVGVHAGAYVEPEITLTADDITALRYDANRRQSSTVLAVRGRFTSPDANYNTVDAALYGDPYADIGDDTQRTSTLDNEVIQSHNHCQRLQKLKFTRANAARVSLTIHYRPNHASRLVAYSRFVIVDYPSRGLDSAVVEIIGRPKLSLRNLTISFDAIVVGTGLYFFDAETEEGEPPEIGDDLTGDGVPQPDNLVVEMSDGGRALASWDAPGTDNDESFTYELEYQPTDLSTPPMRATSGPGEITVLSGTLTDGVEYQFRVRTLSNGATSDWTGYEVLTAVNDPTAPGVPMSFSASAPVGSDVTLSWVGANSPNLYATELYRGTAGTFAGASLIHTAYGGINTPQSYDDTSLAPDTYDWWARSINASGVASAEVGPESQTI